jgi:endogenous inhibitor of DNA gyrase (YacG/DUF329 family)
MMSAPGKSPEPSCPICGKPRAERYRPFCSKRCADIDLNRWLTGRYAVPAAEEDEPDGDAAPGEGEED